MATEKQTTPPRRTSMQLLQRLLPYFWSTDWNVRMRIVMSLVFTIVMIILNVTIPLLLKQIINLLSNCSMLLVGISFITLLLILYGIAWTTARIISELREIFLYRVIERTINIIALSLLEHLHALSIRFHVNKKTGAITNATERVQKAIPDILMGLVTIIPTIVEIILAMGIMWYLYGALYGIALLAILIFSLIFNFLGTAFTTGSQRARIEKNVQAESFFIDSLLNFETVKYFGNQRYEKDRCEKLFNHREEANVRAFTHRGLIGLGQSIILGIGLIFFVWKSGSGVIAGVMTPGDFIAINTYILQFVAPVQYFSYFMRKMNKGLEDMDSAMRILDMKPEVMDAPDAKVLWINEAEVSFDHVSFGYDARRPILRDVSFTIPSGKMVAIVGSTGAGKSTISRLLFRFYDVTGGAIRINGIDIRDVTQESLRKLIGIVPQETVLFNNTLYYNVAYGRPEASEEEVKQAIKLAHLDEFIAMLPDGYNSMVGERGLKLSGGEKQRVAIARVILKQPKIYIFDEATSALDTATERKIQRNLEEVAVGSTTLIIAHRLSTVVHADQIIVLDHGLVAQRGTHQELLENKEGIYYRLWQRQSVCPE
jgi:ABC-type transport system involved in Fe-S cluster assembly fused permease/ATPase subunit